MPEAREPGQHVRRACAVPWVPEADGVRWASWGRGVRAHAGLCSEAMAALAAKKAAAAAAKAAAAAPGLSAEKFGPYPDDKVCGVVAYGLHHLDGRWGGEVDRRHGGDWRRREAVTYVCV